MIDNNNGAGLLRMSFVSFSLESHESCGFDSLEIRQAENCLQKMGILGRFIISLYRDVGTEEVQLAWLCGEGIIVLLS